MSFSIPSSYPAPLLYTGAPDAIRASTLQTILERDRFIFAKQRRVLTSLSPFWTANTGGYDLATQVWVHNSKLTEGSVTIGAYGYNANVKVTVNGVTVTLTLTTAPSYIFSSLATGWPDDTWSGIEVSVQSTSGTGGYFGLYILEDALSALP